MTFNPYSNFGYLALIKQSTTAPVKPTNYLRLISESFTPKFNVQVINEVAGERERNIRNIQGNIEMEGEVEFFVEPKMIGHFLRSICGAPTTQTITSGLYRHCFEILDTTKDYTFDIQAGDAPWAHRFFGAQITKLSLTREDNAIKCTASVMPTKAFIAARVTTAASSGTALAVDQTSGLTTADTILVIDKDDGLTVLAELTIAGVVSETALTVSTIGVSLEVNDIVVIKRATVTASSYTQDNPFQFANGSAIYTGADIDNTTEEAKEDFEIEMMNDVEARYVNGLTEAARFPEVILTKGYSATGKVTKYYSNQSKLDKLRKNEHFGIRFLMQGPTAPVANSATKARSNWGSGNGFYVEAATAGKAGNDLNITITVNTIDTLAASKSGNNILLQLASTTAANNTGTLIAAILDALTGVDAAAVGTGAETFTTAESNVNLGFRSSGTNVVGSDASTKPYVQFDFASAAIDPFFVNNSEDDVVTEEMPLTFYVDSNGSNSQRKNWSSRVFLVNDVSSL